MCREALGERGGISQEVLGRLSQQENMASFFKGSTVHLACRDQGAAPR